MKIGNEHIAITNGFIKISRIEDEWYKDLKDPASFVSELKKKKGAGDIFTFWQRLPETTPKFIYHMEKDSIAAIPIYGFKYWWEMQIGSKTRNMVRKAQTKGVDIRIDVFNDKFVEGITKIFNETPIRQGRHFLHYGKNFETIRREFSKNIFREDLIGAYYKDQLIGFIMLANAERYANITQIISMIAHRDKAPTNALIAEAIKLCEQKKFHYLVYARWLSGSLGQFKRYNGFERIDLPRYYIPLNLKGEIGLKLHIHHGLSEILPEKITLHLKKLRAKWYFMRN